MTEAEWLTATDPGVMVGFVQCLGVTRKQRLTACACLRDLWAGDGRFGRVIGVGERWADEDCSPAEVDAAYEAGWRAFRAAFDEEDYATAFLMHRTIVCVDRMIADPLAVLVRPRPGRTVGTRLRAAGRDAWDWFTLGAAHRRYVPDPESWCPLIRDVWGNPFRPVALRPCRRTPTVLALARGIDADRAWDRLVILSDSLQDAGHPDDPLLAHLRGSGPHARGCWALDLVLGKG